ncbi:T9SS type A sorting domain-containing protein, partial [Flavobacteriales bacterium]|nr:T9SS type A sorting domain-containing protein [Flavobacteriales bacterium]
GQLDDLGCLTCSGWFSATNSEISDIIWNGLTPPEGQIESPNNLSDILQSDEYVDAVNNLWLYNTPDFDNFGETLGQAPWEFIPWVRPIDWVRSGTRSYPENTEVTAPYHNYGDINVDGTQLNQAGNSLQQKPLDPNQVHENQWLVPYKLVSVDYRGRKSESTSGNIVHSIDTIGGGLAFNYKAKSSLDHLINVDVVLTSDTSLWTRCPVIDLSEALMTWTGDPAYANSPPDQSNGFAWPYNTNSNAYWDVEDETGEHGEEKWDIRLDYSVDKMGIEEFKVNEDGDTLQGWGWFPGYAVNVSNGRRLNLMFSENSSLIDTVSNHAIDNPDYTRNMIYDPSPYITDFGDETPNLFTGQASSNLVSMNGGHAVYILDTDYAGSNEENNPHYANYNSWTVSRKRRVIPHIMWVGNWLKNPNQEWLSEDIVIRARVQENYGYRATGFVQGGSIEINPITGDTTVFADTLLNQGYPHYTFNTSDILTRLDDMATKREGLKDVNIVPNPYYGMSGYETGQVDNRVKITNLPRECTISIYTVNGNLIKQVQKDNDIPHFEWDLKNNYNIPIASGVYMIHVDAGEVGEKVLKWFGALRPTDLDSF